MNAEDIKNKAAETMSDAKEKIEAIASDERVQNAKASALKIAIDAKDWIVSNWKSPGWRGKTKVAAAVIVAFFFCRGVFCGWGTSQNAMTKTGSSSSSSSDSNSNNDAADAAALLMLLGAAGNQDAQNSISIWTCTSCGRQIQSKSIPSGTIRCPSGARKYCYLTRSN